VASVPAPKSAEILYRAAEILGQRKEEYSKDMTREWAKVLAGNAQATCRKSIDMSITCGRRAAALRANDSFGATEQNRHESTAVDWRLRNDHAWNSRWRYVLEMKPR